MNKILVSYDLNKVGQNYPKIINALKSYNAEKLLESVWLITTLYDTQQVYNDLDNKIDNNDELIVAQILPSTLRKFN